MSYEDFAITKTYYRRRFMVATRLPQVLSLQGGFRCREKFGYRRLGCGL